MFTLLSNYLIVFYVYFVGIRQTPSPLFSGIHRTEADDIIRAGGSLKLNLRASSAMPNLFAARLGGWRLFRVYGNRQSSCHRVEHIRELFGFL